MTTAVVLALVLNDPGTSDLRGASSQQLNSDRPAVQRAMAQAAVQRQALRTPAARRARKRAQTAYTKLTAGQALRVGRQTHGTVLAQSTPKPLAGARKRGLAVDHFASPYAAVLRPRKGADADEPGVMAMSTLPLRSRDENGQLRLVNLEPERVGDAFVPDNARVKLSIGDRASDGVKLVDRDIAIVPLDVKAVPGVKSADAVFFAGSAEASDHIVRVSPAGVDNLVQLRGTASPERFRYRVDLPAGGTMDEVAGGEIAVRQDGRRVGTITKPKAWDADQRAIPVKTTLQGRVLTLDLAHRGRDIRYPAMLDPNYVDILQYRWYTPGNNNNSTRYWAHRTNRADLMNGVFADAGQGKSLITGTRGNQIVPAGTFAYWTFTAPGTTSVAQAEWTRMTHSEIHNGPAPCIDFGLIYNTTAWHVDPRARGNQNGQPVCSTFTQVYRVTCWDCNDRDGVSHDPAVKGAQFGTSVYQSSIINQIDQVGEVTVYVVDPDDPTVTFTSQAPSGWMNTPNGTIAATGNDPGLGVRTMQIANATPQNNSDCLDAGPCPFSQPISASVASLGLPDGNNAVPVTAKDASFFSFRDANGNPVSAQHQTTTTTPVKLDRMPPTITPSGTLYNARNGFVGPNQSVRLDVTATDGSLASPATQRSGVTSLSATLDGEPMTGGAASAPCTRPEGSCPLSISATLTSEQVRELDPGQHTVVIRAVDALGQTATNTFQFQADAVEPSVFLDGNLANLTGRTLTESSYRLRFEASDNQPFTPEYGDFDDEEPQEVNEPGAGLRDVVVRLDGQPMTTTAASCFDDPQCEQARVWEWDTTNIPNGSHTITITAADNVDNQGVETFEIDLQRAADAPPRVTSTVRRTILGAGLGDRTGNSVTALGDINGDGYADYVVGAPNAAPAGRSGAGAAYIVLGSADASTVDLANPGTATRRISGPGANQYCGTAVAAAGDVNGDDLDDFLVGCPGLDSRLGALTSTGRVYVVFGRTDPQDIDLATPGTSGFVITGPTDTLNLGLPLLTSRPSVFGERLQSSPLEQPAADVNDDGLADIVIGDSAVARGALSAAGAAYVIYGKADDNTVDANALGNSGFVIRGDTASSLTGYSATITADLTGDAISDILVGAPGQTAAIGGRAYIIKGAPYNSEGQPANPDVDLGASNGRAITLTSGQPSDRFGVNVAALGDTDLDDSPDVAIGTSSGAYVLRTAPTTSRPVTVDDGYRVTGPTNAPALLATHVPAAPLGAPGDLDGDERADLIVGYPDTPGARAYTIRSPETARTLDVSALPGQRGAAITTGTQGERAGAAVAGNRYQGTTPVSENAQAIIGAPDANADLLRIGSGRATILSEPTPTGPGVDLPDPPVSEESASSAGAAALRRAPADPFRANVPGLFQVRVNDTFGTRWSTVRNDIQLLVIGSAQTGQDFYVDRQRRTLAAGSGGRFKLYMHGRLEEAINRCGWVIGDNVPGDGTPFPGGTSPRRPCGKKLRLAPRAFARLINCDHCDDGSPTRLRMRTGGPLPPRIKIYRNVRPGTRELKLSPDGDFSTVSGGDITSVNWRYISKSGRFAMVRASSRNPGIFGNNKWAFIERKYLPHALGRGGLCDNTAGQGQGVAPPGPKDDETEFLDYNAQPAQATRRRTKRSDWPLVCSHRKYNVPDSDGP